LTPENHCFLGEKRNGRQLVFPRKMETCHTPQNSLYVEQRPRKRRHAATMTRHEFLVALERQGLRVHRGHLDNAIRNGFLTVTKDRGWRVFTEESVEQMKLYWSDARVGRSRKHHETQGTTGRSS
jgi:hypothetical protein